MSKSEKAKLTAERDTYIEKYKIADRRAAKYKAKLAKEKERYDDRDDDFSASYGQLFDKLKAIRADDSCFSGACKEKFYVKRRLCHQFESDAKLNLDLLEESNQEL